MNPDDLASGRLEGLPSRLQIAAWVLQDAKHRDTFEGWQHYRRTRELLVPPPRLTLRQRKMLPDDRRSDYDTYRGLTNANLPLQETPMLLHVTQLISRRLHGNTLRRNSPTLPGVMVNGWGNNGKTATVCSVAAAFEDQWLELHAHLNPTAVPGTRDLHAPVVYVQTPITATPKSLCESILNFFGRERWKFTLPQLIGQVADCLRDHGVRVLIIDDINRLRMHRADDQDVLDLIRALMSFGVTLILTGVNIPGTGLLREAVRNRAGQLMLPPLEATRVHGLEVTQIERRFEFVELGQFSFDTLAGTDAFIDHLRGIEDHLRLMKSKDGFLSEGTMPEYLRRRTGGVVGLLSRLIEDGAHEAMASGRETLTESQLDEIVIGRDLPPDEIGPAPASDQDKPKRPRRGKKPRNGSFDDRGPRPDEDDSDLPDEAAG